LVESEGFVYKRTQFAKGEPVLDDHAWKLWVPTTLRKDLVEKAHYSQSTGHGGIFKTLERLKEKYYWPGMANDVKICIGQCEVCKCSKSTNFIKRPLMGAQVITERPFQRLYIDFMGPYSRSVDQNTHLFVCLDHFSKFVFLKPMRRATATEVIKFLEKEVFHTFGVPEFVHSDNGKQFVSIMLQNFFENYGIKHIKTAFYSPQANASERVNRSILQIIRSSIKGDQRIWDQYVSDAAFALRSAKHQAINMTPYEVVFGLNMMQHGASYELCRKLKALGQEEFAIDHRPAKQQITREWVLKELKNAHERATKTYNLRAREIKYKVGQVVYRKNFKQSKQIDNYNPKLAPLNIKCVVLKCIGNSLYELANMSGKSLGIYHAKEMFAA